MINVVVAVAGPLLTLDEAKAHLRIETDEENDIVTVYADAAVLSCLRNTARDIVPIGAEPVFKAAALLMLGDLYANREGVIAGQVFSVSPTVDSLLWPYKLIRV